MLKAWGAGGGGGGESKARFRDGALVSTRGEKYVIEKVGGLELREGGMGGRWAAGLWENGWAAHVKFDRELPLIHRVLSGMAARVARWAGLLRGCCMHGSTGWGAASCGGQNASPICVHVCVQ